MGIYKVHYHSLNDKNIDAKEICFGSIKKREAFLADKIIGGPKKTVYALVIHYDPVETDVYVFKNWMCISPIVNQGWRDFVLCEFENYDEAYKYCMELKIGEE